MPKAVTTTDTTKRISDRTTRVLAFRAPQCLEREVTSIATRNGDKALGPTLRRLIALGIEAERASGS